MGPPLHVVGASFGADVSVPTNGVLEIAFDRLLNPATITRQAMPVRDLAGNGVASPVITYDPVLRVVRLQAPSDVGTGDWLEDNQFYSVTLSIPAGDDIQNGLRAIDGATLDAALPAASRVLEFRACSPDPTRSKCAPPVKLLQPPRDPPIRYCDDVQPIFTSHCAGAKCHATPDVSHQPAAGLVLDVGDGVRYTALGKPAQGATVGATSNAQSPGAHFGVNMPVIDPLHPGTSWLLYKLLLAKAPGEDAGSHPARPICGSDIRTVPVTALGDGTMMGDPREVTAAPRASLAADEERARLGDYVLGREMPFPSDPAAAEGAPTDNPALTFEEIERIRLWIAQGAAVESCVPCAVSPGPPPSIPDAGAATDAGINDATSGG